MERSIAQGPSSDARASRSADARAGTGATVVVGLAIAALLLAIYVVSNPSRTSYYNHFVWQALARNYDVKGKNAHDARLVAAMQRHGIGHLLTFNKPDFTRFAGVCVFTPAEVLAGQVPPQ